MYIGNGGSQKSTQRLSDGVSGTAFEHRFGRRVKEDDAVACVDGDDRIHRRPDDIGELRLAAEQPFFRFMTGRDVSCSKDSADRFSGGTADAIAVGFKPEIMAAAMTIPQFECAPPAMRTGFVDLELDVFDVVGMHVIEIRVCREAPRCRTRAHEYATG